MRRRHLVCYDIRDAARLRRVHTTILGFGYFLQYSIYVCDLSAMERIEMVDALSDQIDPEVDSVLVFDLGSLDAVGAPAQRVASLGVPARLPPSGGAAII